MVKPRSLEERKQGALDCASRGWLAVILHGLDGDRCTCGDEDCNNSRGKHPRFGAWGQHATCDPIKLQWLFRQFPNSNFGIKLGPESGIVDLESDNAKGETLLTIMFGGTIPRTPMFSSGRGFHRIFQWRDDLPEKATIALGVADLKLGAGYKLGNGGEKILLSSQSVFPPSWHYSGKQYQWIVSPDECEVAAISDMALNWMLEHEVRKPPSQPIQRRADWQPRVGAPNADEVIAKLRASRQAAKFSRLFDAGDFGNDHSRADAALCSMLAFWTGPDPALIDHIFRQSALMREKWERIDYVERTISYVLSGQRDFYDWDRYRGNGGGNMSFDDLMEYGSTASNASQEPLDAYEANPEPEQPFVEEEEKPVPLVDELALRRGIQDVGRQLMSQSLILPVEHLLDKMKKLGHHAEQVSAGEPKKQLFPRVTAHELLTTHYQIRWLVDYFLTHGQPAIIAGPKKVLKTSIALDLAISLVTGFPFLGKFKIPQRVNVAVMSAESGAATIQETVARICESKGVTDDALVGLNFSWNVPRFDSSEHLEQFETFLDDTQANVVLIDPVYMCMAGAEASNIFDMGARLRNVGLICQAREVTPILVHHFKKGRNADSDGPQLEDIAYAGFQEFARQWVMLDREEEYVPGSGEHKLVLSYGGSAGHSGIHSLEISEGTTSSESARWWAVEISGQKSGKAERAKQKKQDAFAADVLGCCLNIRGAFKATDRGLTKSEIQIGAGSHGKAFNEAFGGMLRSGELKPTIIKKLNNRNYDAYELCPKAPKANA